MDDNEISPWCVSNLDEFLYYCCPECEEKNESKDEFLKHALGEHPESQKYLLKFTIKEEELINNSQNLDFSDDFVENTKLEKIDCEPVMHCYIKEESFDDDNIEDTKDFEFPLNLPEKTENLYEIQQKNSDKKSSSKTESTKTSSRKAEFNCKICEKTFSYKCALKKHIEKAHPEKLNEKCDICGKEIFYLNIAQHKKSVHKISLNENICELCGKSFYYPCALKRHTKQVHDKVKNHKCHLCNYGSLSAFDVKKHIATVHEGKLSFKAGCFL